MKKIIFVVLAIVFFILGVIGLMFPVVPQVPIFLACAFCLARISRRFKHFMVSNRLYVKYLKKHVDKHEKLRNFMYEGLEETEETAGGVAEIAADGDIRKPDDSDRPDNRPDETNELERSIDQS